MHFSCSFSTSFVFNKTIGLLRAHTSSFIILKNDNQKGNGGYDGDVDRSCECKSRSWGWDRINYYMKDEKASQADKCRHLTQMVSSWELFESKKVVILFLIVCMCHKFHVFVMGEDESDVMLLHANYANVCISKFHVLISCWRVLGYDNHTEVRWKFVCWWKITWNPCRTVAAIVRTSIIIFNTKISNVSARGGTMSWIFNEGSRRKKGKKVLRVFSDAR